MVAALLVGSWEVCGTLTVGILVTSLRLTDLVLEMELSELF